MTNAGSGSIRGKRSTADGWRGVVGADFTHDLVVRRARQIATYLVALGRPEAGARVLIGRDARGSSASLARAAAGALSDVGVAAEYVTDPLPTPVLAFGVTARRADIGLMITASHNPPSFNGLKVRLSDGGPPPDSVLDDIEGRQERASAAQAPRPTVDVATAGILRDYVSHIHSWLNIAAIAKDDVMITVDAMHGVTGGLLAALLGEAASIEDIRADQRPDFGGLVPEPNHSTMGPLRDHVLRSGSAFGVAHDGDGDRILAVDEDGSFVSSADLAVLFAHYLAEVRRFSGAIVGTVATTVRLQRLARLLGRTYVQVPIGFRHTVAEMRSQAVLLGIEENGGVGMGHHMLDRDGTAAAALLAEIEAVAGIQDSLARIERLVGPGAVLRRDFRVERPAAVISRAARIERLRGSPVTSRSLLDGVRVETDQGDWLLIRQSGTEDLVRVYGEGRTEDDALDLLREAEDVLAAGGHFEHGSP